MKVQAWLQAIRFNQFDEGDELFFGEMLAFLEIITSSRVPKYPVVGSDFVSFICFPFPSDLRTNILVVLVRGETRM